MDLELKKAIAKKKLELGNRDEDRSITYNNAQDTGLEIERATNILSGKLKPVAQTPPSGESVQLEEKYKDSDYAPSPEVGEVNTDLSKRIAQKKLRKQGM